MHVRSFLLIGTLLLVSLTACALPRGPRSSSSLFKRAAPVEHLTVRMVLKILEGRAPSTRPTGTGEASSPLPQARLRAGAGSEGQAGHAEQRVGIILLNPEGAPIQSVRAWVQFDAEQLVVEDLAVEDGRFILFAPGERTIDPERGLVKLGIASAKPLHDREILVASFGVTRKRRVAGEGPVLTFYDWRAEGEGHTAVLSVRDGEAKNILHVPLSLGL